MNNKRNIIVMFLFVMLSFAIISEVSAVSDAEADGTGFDPSVKSVNMRSHDIASERINDNKFMQNHDNNHMDDLKSHNKQNSFNKSPEFGDKNIENKNFYEHKMDDGRNPSDFNHADANKSMDIPKSPDNKFNSSSDLRDMNLPAVHGGEAVKNVIPNIKKDEKNLTRGPMNNHKPVGNVSDQHGSDNKNKSAMLPADIKNNQSKDIKSEDTKNVKRGNAKPIKQSAAKDVKNNKPESIKKVNNGKSKAIIKPEILNKNSKKGMAKL